jgi:hypothetical protein
MIGIHGFERKTFKADHLFLLNTLFGFKINKHYHLGLNIDICDFFEREAITYLIKVENSDYFNNLIFGFNFFSKWTPGWLFDIVFETGFGMDVGEPRIYGPVFGLYIQKVFILNFKKIKEKVIKRKELKLDD